MSSDEPKAYCPKRRSVREVHDAGAMICFRKKREVAGDVPGVVGRLLDRQYVLQQGIVVRESRLDQTPRIEMTLNILLKSCATPPARRPTDSHLLRLDELRFEFCPLLLRMLPLGDVANDGPHPDGLSGVVAQEKGS